MFKLILSLAGLFVAVAAWAASARDSRNRQSRNESFNKNGFDNFKDFSGGMLGI